MRRGNYNFISQKGKTFRALVVRIIQDLKFKSFGKKKLKAIIYAYPPDKRQRDLDNLLKATLDAIQHSGLYEDDSQIDDLRIIRGEPMKGGLLGVYLEEIT